MTENWSTVHSSHHKLAAWSNICSLNFFLNVSVANSIFTTLQGQYYTNGVERAVLMMQLNKWLFFCDSSIWGYIAHMFKRFSTPVLTVVELEMNLWSVLHSLDTAGENKSWLWPLPVCMFYLVKGGRCSWGQNWLLTGESNNFSSVSWHIMLPTLCRRFASTLGHKSVCFLCLFVCFWQLENSCSTHTGTPHTRY